jgi:hypothetical protein
MNILVCRQIFNKTETIGRLFFDGQYMCDTLEDKDRGLRQDMANTEISRIKIYQKTR